MTTVPYLGPGFRLEVPSTWMVFSSGEAQASFLMPPYDTNRAMTLLVRLSHIADVISADQVAQSARRAQEKNYTGFQDLGGETLTGDIPRVIQRVRWQPPEGDAVVQFHLFCVAESHVLFAVTATRPETLTPEEATAWDAEVSAVLESFAVQPPVPVQSP